MKKTLALLLAPALALSCVPKQKTLFRAAPSALQPVTCIAVLPFENLSSEPAAGDGFADLVATELISSGRFQVMDRGESARILATRGIFLTASVDAQQARTLGDVLGVQAIVLGTIDEWRYQAPERHDRPSRPMVGVTAKLVDVKTGDPLWGASFTGSPTSFFSDSTAPLHLAAQRVAADLSGGLLEGAGGANPPAKPCWNERAQSVLATLAPGAGPSRTPAVASASPTPAKTPLILGSSPTPAPSSTPTAVAMVTATPAPTPAPKVLTASQTSMLERLKPQTAFALDGVAFTGMTATLAESATAPLADLGAVLAAHPEVKLRIEAHVDPTDPGPVPLSQKRAEQVLAKLIAGGATATQLEAKGMGGSHTLFPSFVEAMKAKNRRVEVFVNAGPTGGAAVAAASPAATPATATGDSPRVKVQASKGQSAPAVKLANTLKLSGTKIVAVSQIPEERKATLVYFMPAYKADAQKLASSISVPGGAKTSAANSLGAGVDILIIVGADLK